MPEPTFKTRIVNWTENQPLIVISTVLMIALTSVLTLYKSIQEARAPRNAQAIERLRQQIVEDIQDGERFIRSNANYELCLKALPSVPMNQITECDHTKAEDDNSVGVRIYKHLHSLELLLPDPSQNVSISLLNDLYEIIRIASRQSAQFARWRAAKCGEFVTLGDKTTAAQRSECRIAFGPDYDKACNVEGIRKPGRIGYAVKISGNRVVTVLPGLKYKLSDIEDEIKSELMRSYSHKKTKLLIALRAT